MIIGEHYADVVHGTVNGKEATTWPPVGDGPASNAPPSSVTRSRMAVKPTPVTSGRLAARRR